MATPASRRAAAWKPWPPRRATSTAGLLAPAASPARLDLLTDTIWVLAGPAVYVDLVHRRQWPTARYATWLTDQLDHAVASAQRT
jgi:hypothetical protein